jgi:biopolymer transport protein ExbD
MNSHTRSLRPIATIDTLPHLLFVVLLLATAYGATPMYTGYGPWLPTAATATPHKGDHPTFGIDIVGRYFEHGAINPGPIPPSALTGRLRAAYVTHPGDHVLYLMADRGVAYSAVLNVVDAAQEVGVREIGLIAECPRGQESLFRLCHPEPRAVADAPSR